MFAPFTQAEVSLDRPQAGLGIGLTLVKSLVERRSERVAQLCAFQPALGFIDIGLPGLDGYRLVTEARANPSLRAAS